MNCSAAGQRIAHAGLRRTELRADSLVIGASQGAAVVTSFLPASDGAATRRRMAKGVENGLMAKGDRSRVRKSAIHSPAVLGEAYDYPQKVAFSRGMRVELDNHVMLFISGTASVNERGQSVHVGDVTAQTHRALSNISGLLASENADWHDVVRTTWYLADFRYYDLFNAVRNAFFEQEKLNPFPASTCVEARLCRPELLVEIEAIALLPSGRK